MRLRNTAAWGYQAISFRESKGRKTILRVCMSLLWYTIRMAQNTEAWKMIIKKMGGLRVLQYLQLVDGWSRLDAAHLSNHQ
jgi:hypothetical protein